LPEIDARRAWRQTSLAAAASYLESGSVVAGAVGLTLWAEAFGLGTGAIGLIGAISSNALSAAVGAFVGGWLCDRYGRRTVYQWDLLFYAFGVAWIVAAVEPWMLIVGYVFTGLAVGADVPASWTLVAEGAPARRHGRHGAAAQLAWSLGPFVVLVSALAMSGLGLLGIRIIFAHLLVVALVLWRLRRGLRESTLWRRSPSTVRDDLTRLCSRVFLWPLLFLTAMYALYTLKAGTNGFFLPYILRTVGGQSQATSVVLQIPGLVLGALGTIFIFMRFIERRHAKWMLALAVALQGAAMGLFAVFDVTTVTAVCFVFLNGLGIGFGPQMFVRVWSVETFPTALRGTALGLMYGSVRVVIGVWYFVLPALTATGFHMVAWFLLACIVASGLLGIALGPSNAGRSLAELHPEEREPAGSVM
jgi:inositol transporter-like SP family MFS transporter